MNPPPLPALAMLAYAARCHLLTNLACDPSSVTLIFSASLLFHPRQGTCATLTQKSTLSCGQGPQVTWTKAGPAIQRWHLHHTLCLCWTHLFPCDRLLWGHMTPNIPWGWNGTYCSVFLFPSQSSAGSKVMTSDMLEITSGFSMTGNYGYICH